MKQIQAQSFVCYIKVIFICPSDKILKNQPHTNCLLYKTVNSSCCKYGYFKIEICRD